MKIRFLRPPDRAVLPPILASIVVMPLRHGYLADESNKKTGLVLR